MLASLCGAGLAFGQDCKYIVVNYNGGSMDMTLTYGCGQQANYREIGKSVSIQSNDVCTAANIVYQVDTNNQTRGASAIDILRRSAPPIVASNPCPQQCAPAVPIRGYCGRIVGYSGGGNCCAPTTGYCGRPVATGYCGTPAYRTGYCGRPVATGYCGAPVGYGYDGRNPMIAYQPGDPRAVCHCVENPNRGGPCGCPGTCTQCNPNHIVAYAR